MSGAGVTGGRWLVGASKYTTIKRKNCTHIFAIFATFSMSGYRGPVGGWWEHQNAQLEQNFAHTYLPYMRHFPCLYVGGPVGGWWEHLNAQLEKVDSDPPLQSADSLCDCQEPLDRDIDKYKYI